MPRLSVSSAVRAVAAVRAAPLAGSVAWKQLTDDPVRAAVLAHRLVPRRVKKWAHPVLARAGGPLMRALVRWDDSRTIAREEIEAAGSARAPRRLASLALAVDLPDVAARAIERLPAADRVRAILLARLAHQEGRLHDALDILAASRPSPPTAAHMPAAPSLLPLLPVILQKFKPASSNFCKITGKGALLRRRIEGELAALDPARRWAAPTARRIEPVPGRILHIVTNALPYKSAGYTVRTQRVALAQREIGLDAQVVTRLGFPVAQGVLDGRRYTEIDGVPYHRLLPRTLPRTADAALARGVELASGLVERTRPAVLHAASNHVNGQIALALRDRFGLPVVYEVRGFLEESWLSRADGRDPDCDHHRLSRELETHCMREADLVVTLGEAMAEEIAGRGVPADKILIVPNAADDEFLDPLPDAGDLRTRLGIPEDAVVVGTASTFYGYEGIDTLLRAGAELRRRDAPVRLLLVGDGPQLPALRRLASEIGVGEIVTFTGRVPFEDVRRYHAVLDVFAVPRTNDRVCQLVTPLKPVEAMAGGLPVIASDVRALREIVEQGVTGVLIPPEDPRALAECLEKLLYSPNRRRELGLAARDRVARDRTWRTAAVRYRTAYTRLGALGRRG